MRSSKEKAASSGSGAGAVASAGPAGVAPPFGPRENTDPERFPTLDLPPVSDTPDSDAPSSTTLAPPPPTTLPLPAPAPAPAPTDPSWAPMRSGDLERAFRPALAPALAFRDASLAAAITASACALTIPRSRRRRVLTVEARWRPRRCWAACSLEEAASRCRARTSRSSSHSMVLTTLVSHSTSGSTYSCATWDTNGGGGDTRVCVFGGTEGDRG
jgi:hypothetical protein